MSRLVSVTSRNAVTMNASKVLKGVSSKQSASRLYNNLNQKSSQARFFHSANPVRFCSSSKNMNNPEIINEAEFVDAEAAEKETTKEPEKVHMSENETLKGETDNLTFQAETQKLLQIVAHSLYSDRQVFVREIISNASDALEKLRYLQTTNETNVESNTELKIDLFVDEDKKIFAIQDNGVGMTREELCTNLGTIAHSGSKSFLNKLEEAGTAKEGIIGQFGVGFYSTFMVGNNVTVYSKSCKPNSVGYCWKSDGMGSFSITEAENVEIGTKIVIDLKDDALDYSKQSKVTDLVKNMSNFIAYPVSVNGDVVNTVQPLWTMDPKNISEEQHSEFYRFVSHMWDSPKYNMHFKTDAPIDIKSLFYFPSMHTEKFGMGQMEPGVSLYSRKVLIQKKPEKLLPTWLRFVKGVVDSADIPLNLSRELLQDNRLVLRMNDIFTGRIIKFLEGKLKKDAKDYDVWYAEFGNFIREGVCTDDKNRKQIARLLRMESSNTPAGELTSLQHYVKAMPEGQESIYFVNANNRALAESSPYMEAFKDKEVLFLYEPLDEIVMSNLQEFEGKKIISVETSEKSNTEDAKGFEEECKWFQDSLGDKVASVKASARLSSSPALVVDHESAAMRRMLRQIDSSRVNESKANLEINFEHDLVKQLLAIRESEPELAKRLASQILDNSLLAAGMIDDPRTMLPALNRLMADVLNNTSTSKKEI